MRLFARWTSFAGLVTAMAAAGLITVGPALIFTRKGGVRRPSR